VSRFGSALPSFGKPEADAKPESTTLGGSGASWSPVAFKPPGGEGDEDQYVHEEEVTSVPGWTPSVSLEIKEKVETGEEDEEELYSQRSKLYRFKDADWKERGTGEAKLLRNSQTGMVRFLLRQEKTMKIVANHYVIDQAPYCDLRPNAGSAKCWVWTAMDCADGDPVAEQFALKFGAPELAEKFKEAFDAAKGPAGAAPSAAASAAKPAPEASAKESNDWRGGKFQAEQGEGEYDEDYYADEADGADEHYDAQHDGEATWNGGGASQTSGGCFAELAQLQKQGWRCTACRLQWGDEVVECVVCEIPRPGHEDAVGKDKAEKEKGIQNAASLFLGSSTSATPAATGFGGAQNPASGGLFSGLGNASTAPSLFGALSATSSGAPLFGSMATASATQPPAPPLFGAPSATSPSSAPLFGTAGSTEGAMQPPAPPMFGVPPPPPPAPAAAPTTLTAPAAFTGPRVVPPPPGAPGATASVAPTFQIPAAFAAGVPAPPAPPAPPAATPHWWQASCRR